MAQYFDIDVIKEFAIRGNAAILKCLIPSFVADFVSVVSWHTDQNENFYPGSSEGICKTHYLIEENSTGIIQVDCR